MNINKNMSTNGDKNIITIFTDGASRNNPGNGGWGAVVASSDLVEELGGAESPTTNNRMEISGAIFALQSEVIKKCIEMSGKEGKSSGKDASVLVELHTDSMYLINGITKWVHGWKKNGWITGKKDEVLNRDLWEKLYDLVTGLGRGSAKIAWIKVEGHSGVPANERCDEIATSFADGVNIDLYKGARDSYKVSLFLGETGVGKKDGVSTKSVAKKSKVKISDKSAYYLSLLNGVLDRHTVWKDCEMRVKGKSGARWKKVRNISEEENTLKNWGI
ncbi:MAG: ribonuclease HI [Candidatus Taylorbacteria bacterium]|nr:ribonuclease HI [Candidatus Taylorbacteria bacterium]